MNKRSIRWKSEYGMLLVLLLFFGGLLVLFGVQEYPDSETYIRMYRSREPVYPIFLWICRKLFGDHYFWAVGILQNAFAAASIYCLLYYVNRKFSLNWFGRFCLLGIFLMPHLLTPLASTSHMVYTNSILSEGISFSLYNVFSYFLLKTVWEQKKIRYYLAAATTALLLSLTRGQLMPMILACGVAGIYAVLTSDRYHKRMIACLVAAGLTIVSFMARDVITKSYNYLRSDVYVGNLGGGSTFLTNVIYSARTQDGDGITDEGIRRTFYYIQEKAQEAGWTLDSAGEGMLERAIHLEDCHDLIKFEQVEIFITWYLNNELGLDDIEREVQKDVVAMEMVKSVLPHSLGRWLQVYAGLAMVGLIRTVAVVQPVLNWFAFGMYLFSIAGMVYLWYKDRKNKAAQGMLLVFLLIGANVSATSMTIMCLSRYMIYNMSLFYMAGYLVLWELWKVWKQKRKKGTE